MTVLTGEAILKLCEGDEPFISNAVDLKAQIQQNGVDLTVKIIERQLSQGTIDFDNSRRELSKTIEETPFEESPGKYIYDLYPGTYLVTFNEVIRIRNNLMCYTLPRSTLMRCGAMISAAVGDAGYKGKFQCQLNVYNPCGIRIYRDARVAQMVVEELSEEVKRGYSGMYQGDGL